MKKALSILLSCLFLIGTSSCAPKNANQLISQARREHGSCTVVSKTTADGETTVVLHDELQDFDYTVRSFRSKINIDGANAGSYPDSRDSSILWPLRSKDVTLMRSVSFIVKLSSKTSFTQISQLLL